MNRIVRLICCLYRAASWKGSLCETFNDINEERNKKVDERGNLERKKMKMSLHSTRLMIYSPN